MNGHRAVRRRRRRRPPNAATAGHWSSTRPDYSPKTAMQPPLSDMKASSAAAPLKQTWRQPLIASVTTVVPGSTLVVLSVG
jgi:hypothetical protein